MRTKRQCKDCEKEYRSNDKYGALCDECKTKIRKIASKKRVNTMSLTMGFIFVFMFCIILESNLVSALRVEFIDTETILPGEASTILIAIKNDGDEDIRDISIKLDFQNQPFAPFNSNSEYGIDELKDGKTKIADFSIIALDVQSGVYKIPLEISYRIDEETTIKTKSSLISLIVDTTPVIIVNPVGEAVTLKGKSNQINFEVLNKGLSDVYFLEAEIGESDYFTTLNNLYYLGDISGDDWENAEFTLYINSDAPNLLTIPIKLNYQDVLNNRYHKDLNINIRTYSTEEAIEVGLVAKDYTPIMIGGGIGLVIVFIIYRKIKKFFKNRNRNKDNGDNNK